MKRKVYIPNAGCHDFSLAEKYGEIVNLTEGKLKLSSVGAIYREMYPILSKSDPDDCILICGPTIANIVATTLFGAKHSCVNLLIYATDGVTPGCYLRRTIKL